jgi:hypothetical protein
LAGNQRQALNDLEKLTPPASMADDWKAFISDGQKIAEDTVKLAESVRTSNSSEQDGINTALASLERETLTITKRNGFVACSQL